MQQEQGRCIGLPEFAVEYLAAVDVDRTGD